MTQAERRHPVTGIGNLKTRTDARGVTVSYGYDARGNLTSVSHTVLGQVYLTQYGYDSADRRIRVTYPSGRVVDTPRDSAGRISGVSTTYEGLTQTLASDLAYDPFGPLKSFTYGNGVSRSVDYDLDGRIEAVESDPVQSLDYTYNILDQLTDLTDLGLTGLDQSFGYDVLDRLTSASGGYGSQGFSYDGVGDRLTLTEAAGTDSYAYSAGSHRLESITGPNAQTRSYDAVGNTTVLGAYDLDYGDNNRLSAARLGSTPLAEYTYDGNGERMIKTEGAQSTVYHYDLQGRLIAETDAEGQTLREYIYLEGEPLALIEPGPGNQCAGTDPVISGEMVGAGQTYYCQASGSITADDDGLQINTGGEAILAAPLVVLRSGLRVVLGGAFAVGREATPPTTGALYFIHPDHLGTPRLVTDANQAVVWRWDSTPFGESAPNEDPDGDGHSVVLNLRFPGQYYDQETGLSYNYFRYYDPSTGRYVTSDPVGLAAGLNTYAYVANNPLRFIDPLGLAYFAKRPLSGMPWMGPGSCNPIDDFFNTEISHEQLFFEDGKSPSNIGFSDDGTLKSEPNPTGYRCRSGKYNDCIMRKAVANVGPLPSYCLIGRNCQTWAERVREEYARLAQDPQVQKECQECKQ